MDLPLGAARPLLGHEGAKCSIEPFLSDHVVNPQDLPRRNRAGVQGARRPALDS